MTEPVGELEQARLDVELSHGELWFRYFELGGMSTALEVEAYLYGALRPTHHDRDRYGSGVASLSFSGGETFSYGSFVVR